jgi:hypothetical protein
MTLTGNFICTCSHGLLQFRHYLPGKKRINFTLLILGLVNSVAKIARWPSGAKGKLSFLSVS